MWVFLPKNLIVLLCLISISNTQIVQINKNDQDFVMNPELIEAKRKLAATRVKDLVSNVGLKLLPKAIETFYSLNLSSPCIRDALRVATGMRQMKTWAFKFLDASSKSIDGLLDLSIVSFGDYDECVNIQVFNRKQRKDKKDLLLRGKYCKVLIRPYVHPKSEKTKSIDFVRKLKDRDDDKRGSSVFMAIHKEVGKISEYMSHFDLVWRYGHLTGAICVPSGCTEDDVNKALKAVDDYIGVSFHTPGCDVKTEPEFSSHVIASITLFSFFGFLIVVGSALDLYISYRKKPFRSTAIRILTSFSFPSNFKKIMDTSSSSNSVSCLHGMRSITMLWVIYTHSIMRFMLFPQKPTKIPSIVEDFAFQFMMNASVDVDSFFFITGFLVCRGLTQLVRIQKKPFHVGMYIFARIWRIVPMYALYIASIFLYPLAGSGPEFREHAVNNFIDPCRRNWWTNMLFIHNYYKNGIGEMCAEHTWYLSADMQLHIAAIALLIPLMRWPKVGIALTVASILASMVTSYVFTESMNMLPMFTIPKYIDDAGVHIKLYYHLPYVHVGPYCVGLLCGYLLALHPKLKIPKGIQIFGWCAAITACLCIVYGPHKWVTGTEPTFLETLFYSSCYRVAWTMGVAWIVVCCSTGRGGVVNYILSWQVWIPLGRISFFAYLIHVSVIIIHTTTVKTETAVDYQSITWSYAGDLMISQLLALVASVCLEAPFISIGKILFRQGSKPTAKETEQNEQLKHDEAFSKDGEIAVVFSDHEKHVQKQDGNYNPAFTSRM